MKTIIGVAVACGLLLWAGCVFAWRYFAAIHVEQTARDGQLNRRQISLEAWSDELELIDSDGVLRARQKAHALLERALGPAPLPADDGRLL